MRSAVGRARVNWENTGGGSATCAAPAGARPPGALAEAHAPEAGREPGRALPQVRGEKLRLLGVGQERPERCPDREARRLASRRCGGEESDDPPAKGTGEAHAASEMNYPAPRFPPVAPGAVIRSLGLRPVAAPVPGDGCG